MRKTKPDTAFATRVLMGMRNDIETLVETAARMRIQYDVLAKEHGLDAIYTGQIEDRVSPLDSQIEMVREYGLAQ